MSRTLALAGAAAAALVLASRVEAAAPRYILVSGDGMPRPVLLDDWSENLELLVSLVDARHANASTVRALPRRPRLRLGLFWRWPENPRPTRPEDADQTAWLYPALGAEPAVIELLPSEVERPRIVPARALRILARHGVPTRMTVPAHWPEQPTRCDRAEVRTLVRHVVAAFNRGDLAALDRHFAPTPGFRVYFSSAPGKRSMTVRLDRPSLVPYFARRHARADRLRLRSLRVNANTAANPPYGNFTFTLTRNADDLEPTRYQGKGAVYCFRTRPDGVFVWSMAPARLRS